MLQLKTCFKSLKSDLSSAVPHSQRCNQRHGHGLLVCRRGRSHHDACTNRCSWKVFGSVDCIAESRAVGWRCHQVSPKLYRQVIILTVLSVSQRTTRREQMEALPRTPTLLLWSLNVLRECIDLSSTRPRSNLSQFAIRVVDCSLRTRCSI